MKSDLGPVLPDSGRMIWVASPQHLPILGPHSSLGSVFTSSCISQLSDGSYLCPGEILRFSRPGEALGSWVYVSPLFLRSLLSALRALA